MKILESVAFWLGIALVAQSFGLSMQEAIDKALDYSAKVESKRNLLQTATYQKRSSLSAFLPTFSANYVYSYYDYPGVTDYLVNAFNISGNINVFRGFKDYLSLKESDQNLARKRLDLQNSLADIKLQTKLAYIQILQAKALLQTATESKNLLFSQLQKANSFYQQGLRAKNEVLTMELQHSSALITFQSAKQNLNYALNALSNLIGTQVKINEIQEINKVAINEYDLKDLLSQALSNNPDYLYIKSQLESAKLALRSATANFLPQLDISGVKYWHVNDVNPVRYTYSSLQSQIGLNISWNLFNGLNDKWQHQIKRYDLLSMQNDLAQFQMDLELSLHSLLRDYESAKHQLKIAQDSLKRAKENYTIINNRYLQNLSTYTELIDAQLLLTSMQTNINQARYNIVSIQSNIERIVNP